MSQVIKKHQDTLMIEDQEYRLRIRGSKCYETRLNRDERYLLNKMNHEIILKLEEKMMSDTHPTSQRNIDG